MASKLSKVSGPYLDAIIGGGGGGGGGGAYSYIRVLRDGFLLKVIVFTLCEHEYMNIHTPIIASSYGSANEVFKAL